MESYEKALAKLRKQGAEGAGLRSAFLRPVGSKRPKVERPLGSSKNPV